MNANVLLFGCLLGVAIAAPQNGYNFPQPQRPSNLYQQPSAPRLPPPPPPPPRPQQPPQNGYRAPQPSNLNPVQADAPMEGMPYDFQWGVEDAESGNSYSHVESSDGQTTQGEYRVLLPDGRTQVVKFFDNGGGFNAEVTYEK